MTKDDIKAALEEAIASREKGGTNYQSIATSRQQALAMAWQFQPGRPLEKVLADAAVIEAYFNDGTLPPKLKAI